MEEKNPSTKELVGLRAFFFFFFTFRGCVLSQNKVKKKIAQRFAIWPVVCCVPTDLDTSGVGRRERDRKRGHAGRNITHTHSKKKKSDEINRDVGVAGVGLGKYAEPN